MILTWILRKQRGIISMLNENTIVFSDWLFICNMDYDKKFIDLNKLKDIKSPNIPIKYLGKVKINRNLKNVK